MDTRVLEQLASKICHDLVSPVGAVNNGVEFLEDMGPDALEDALGLIKYSAAQASAKLQAFRLAYGAGGADPNIKPEDIQRAFSALISAEGKVSQSWDPFAPLGQKEKNPPGFCKILMASLMLGQEFLPKGGTISVRAGEPGHTIVTAEGEVANVKEGVEDALKGKTDPDTLTPQLVHPYALGQIAELHGYSVTLGERADNFVMIYIAGR